MNGFAGALPQDTFLDLEHLKASFPGNEFEVVNNSVGSEVPVPPFRVTFPWGTEVKGGEQCGGKRTSAEASLELPRWKEPLAVESYTPPNPGPYLQDQPRINTIRFTPVQVEAVLLRVAYGIFS